METEVLSEIKTWVEKLSRQRWKDFITADASDILGFQIFITKIRKAVSFWEYFQPMLTKIIFQTIQNENTATDNIMRWSKIGWPFLIRK